MVVLLVSLALASAPVVDETAVVSPNDRVAPVEPTLPSTNPEAALHQLAAAHALRAADDLPAAIEAASHALDNDPELAAAYLTRAQMRAELATDAPPEGRAARATWAETLRAAADDLQAYMDRAPLDATARDAIAVERDRLRAIADAHEHASPPPEPSPTTTSATPSLRPSVPAADDRDPRPTSGRRRNAAGPSLVGLGVAATAAAAGLGASSLQVRQHCTALCDAGWSSRAGLAGAATVSAAIGALATGWGTARWIDARPPSRRARTIASATVLSAAGLSTAAGATLLGLARARWNGVVPSDGTGLAQTQRLANAGVAVLSVVPSLVTGGLVTMLARRRNSAGLARVQR